MSVFHRVSSCCTASRVACARRHVRRIVHPLRCLQAMAAVVCACVLAAVPVCVPAAVAADDSSGSFVMPAASVSQVDDPQCLPRGTSPSSSSYEQAIRLLFSPDGSTAYTVPLPAGDTICRVDVASMTVTGKADLSGVTLEPTGTAEISDDGSHILLAVDDNGQGGMGLSIATADMSVTRLPVSSWWFVPSPDGATAYAYTNSDPSSPQTRRIVSLSTADGTITDEKTIDLPYSMNDERVLAVSPDRLTWYVAFDPSDWSERLVSLNAATGDVKMLPVRPTRMRVTGDAAGDTVCDGFHVLERRAQNSDDAAHPSLVADSDTLYLVDAVRWDASDASDDDASGQCPVRDGDSTITPVTLSTGQVGQEHTLAGFSETSETDSSLDGSVLAYSFPDGTVSSTPAAPSQGVRFVSARDWSVMGEIPTILAGGDGNVLEGREGALTSDGSAFVMSLFAGGVVSDGRAAAAPAALRVASTDGACVADYSVNLGEEENATENPEKSMGIVGNVPMPGETGIFLTAGDGFLLTKVSVPDDWADAVASTSSSAGQSGRSGDERVSDARGRTIAIVAVCVVAAVAAVIAVIVVVRRRGTTSHHD